MSKLVWFLVLISLIVGFWIFQENSQRTSVVSESFRAKDTSQKAPLDLGARKNGNEHSPVAEQSSMTEDTPNPSDGAANEVLSLDTEGLQPAMESDPNWAENFSRLSSPSLNDLKLGTGLRVYDAFVMDCAGAVVGEAKLRSIAVEPKGRNLVVDISQGTEALSLSTQEQPNRFRIDTNRVGTESVLYLRISENETLQFPIDPFRKRQKQFSAYIQQNREPRPGYIRDQSCWRMVLRETKN